MTWYSNEMQVLVVITWFVSLIVIATATYFLIEDDDIFKGFIILVFILATTFGTYEYIIKADEKQHEEIVSKYKYEAKANYERLNDKLAETLGSEKYFIKDDKVVKIDPALDLFMDLIVIRDATEKEIELYEEYRKARSIYMDYKYK